MDSRPASRVALMSIQPRFAQAILSGDKRVEFRKRRLAHDIKTVLIYETAPSQRIVGRFAVAGTVEATPTALWRQFGSVGGISRRELLGYYAGHERAVALVIQNAERYKRPIPLGGLRASPTVPQSFSYLPASSLEELASMQPASSVGVFANLVGGLGQALRRVRQGVLP